MNDSPKRRAILIAQHVKEMMDPRTAVHSSDDGFMNIYLYTNDFETIRLAKQAVADKEKINDQA